MLFSASRKVNDLLVVMVNLDLNKRARRPLNSGPNEDASSKNAAPTEAAFQTGWVGTLLFYRGALY